MRHIQQRLAAGQELLDGVNASTVIVTTTEFLVSCFSLVYYLLFKFIHPFNLIHLFYFIHLFNSLYLLKFNPLVLV